MVVETQLLIERQYLLNRKFSRKITPKEEYRLTQIRHELDKIEQEKNGNPLQELESLVFSYEQFKEKLDKLLKLCSHG